jgi:hypothetical protein
MAEERSLEQVYEKEQEEEEKKLWEPSLTDEHISLLTMSINKLTKADLVYLLAGTAYAAIIAKIHS